MRQLSQEDLLSLIISHQQIVQRLEAGEQEFASQEAKAEAIETVQLDQVVALELLLYRHKFGRLEGDLVVPSWAKQPPDVFDDPALIQPLVKMLAVETSEEWLRSELQRLLEATNGLLGKSKVMQFFREQLERLLAGKPVQGSDEKPVH